MDELKECPFCGGIGLMKSGPHDDYDVEYWVQCHSCAAQGGWMK
ncbi:MAG: Lar family restriction alleviation protein, partial [Candidatus Omnitrophica bacterium]|nr:Lar family restriction alleviation protein [Candidatus Omnitrophota bacterium]